MRNQNIKIFKPKSEIISKYIEFYYEYELIDEEYFAFPANNRIVSLTEKAEIVRKGNIEYIQENSKFKNSFYGLNFYTKPLLIKTKGKVKEFVIIFKPYGLAQFTSTNFCKQKSFRIEEFNEFSINHPAFFMYSIDVKIQFFESFLLSLLKEKGGLDIVVKSIELFEKDTLTIEDIAKECNCSYKKLYRLFNIHCGTTPTIIRKTMRFRRALKKMKNKNSRFKLSDVAFDLGYYDQAIFNKAFKQLTGESPRNFFKSVNLLRDGDMYFKSLK